MSSTPVEGACKDAQQGAQPPEAEAQGKVVADEQKPDEVDHTSQDKQEEGQHMSHAPHSTTPPGGRRGVGSLPLRRTG